MKQINYKKLILPNIPYVFFVYLFDKVGQAVRLAPGADISAKILNITQGFSAAFENALPSVYPLDLLVGIVGAVIIRLIVYVKGKNAKKYRKGAEYGSARWGNAEDIKPYIDPDFQNNIILTQTERLTMNSRPKQPKYARNKNVVVIGGSGSGKTRFFVKPNLMQLHSSYVLTDPKGTVLIECGKLLQRAGYRIKVLNTINPALAHSNPISRFWQKQRIKKQYAKTLKAGGKAKKTAEATAKAAKKTAQETKRATFFVVRHWKGCLIVGGIAFIVLLLFGGLSSCSLFGGNSGSGLIASSYLSEDADITGAESAYAAMEAELQDMLDNIESEYPGYDEYRVNADEIEHDPYVLISILSAWHEGVFTLDEVQSTLEMLFEKQYILTVEEEVQVRYRTETRTDSEGNPYTVEVPYNYYILHVDLENFNLSHVPVYIMGEEQLSMYAMYMSSLGNRPDLFPQSGYVSKYYENPPADYEVPAALLGSDEKFARLMEEADKYVGFPYVWGGSTPETSFDCSGFVSYVLTNSGLYNTGRLGAQGLYNISTPVSNPQPGDLVFFTGTYDTPGVSHVGIYVGEDGDGSPVMLHCGDPIQYSKLDTSYWQSHFYAYGRLNYN